jgi:hypothetical protein
MLTRKGGDSHYRGSVHEQLGRAPEGCAMAPITFSCNNRPIAGLCVDSHLGEVNMGGIKGGHKI